MSHARCLLQWMIGTERVIVTERMIGTERVIVTERMIGTERVIVTERTTARVVPTQ